jgi:hypothetical protein
MCDGLPGEGERQFAGPYVPLTDAQRTDRMSSRKSSFQK